MTLEGSGIHNESTFPSFGITQPRFPSGLFLVRNVGNSRLDCSWRLLHNTALGVEPSVPDSIISLPSELPPACLQTLILPTSTEFGRTNPALYPARSTKVQHGQRASTSAGWLRRKY